MSLSEKRIQARKMRKDGESIRIIAANLQVSRGSVSDWCHDIVLTEDQIENLKKRGIQLSMKGRMIGAKINKQKRIDAINNADTEAKRLIGEISERETILILTALYWAEGTKSYLSGGFLFVNSDPDMILCVARALIIIGVNHEDLYCNIQINEIHRPRIGKVLNFWKKLLGLKSEQIGNPSFVKTTLQKHYENHDNYFGICRLKVRRGTALKYKVLGLIKALKNDILLPV